MMIRTAILLSVASSRVLSAPPVIGPYATASMGYTVPVMDSSDSRVWLVYPNSTDKTEKFPLREYPLTTTLEQTD